MLKVYTFGGGATLEKAFNAVAAIFKTAAFSDNLLVVAVSFGFGFAIYKTVSAFSFGPLIKQFLVPVFLMFTLFSVGSKEILIYDELAKTDGKPRVYKVDNVPVLLAYSASFMSSISKGLTSLFEKAMHEVDDPTYNWTGHLYAGRTLLANQQMRLIDGTTKENFRRFCHNCVRHDIGLGLYTWEELEKAPDLLGFLMERSSHLRGTGYRMQEADIVNIERLGWDAEKAKAEKPIVGEIRRLRCQAIAEILKSRIQHQILAANKFVLNNVSSDYQKLLHLSDSESNLIKLLEQKTAIEHIQNYTYGNQTAFGAAKAEMQQIEGQKMQGLLSMSWIIALRNYLEALLYLFFPLVVLITLLFLGFKAIQAWLFLLGWVGMWPPCYVCANFLLTSLWDQKAEASGLLGKGYTLFTSEGLFQLHNQMEGIAFGVFASIPIISLALISLAKGGATALAHWAGSLGAFGHGAAAQAAAETVSGNYSFDNVSAGGRNIANTSMFHKEISPHMNYDTVSTKDATGARSSSLIGESFTLDEKGSNLLSSPAFRSGIQENAQVKASEAESLAEASSENFSATLQMTTHSTEGLNRHAATSLSSGLSQDGSYSAQAQTLFQNAYSKAEDFAESTGQSTNAAMEESLHASLGIQKILGGGIGGRLGSTYSQLDSEQATERYQRASNTHESFNEAASFALANKEALSREEGGREYVDWAQQWSQSQNAGYQYNKVFNEHQSWEKMKSLSENLDLSATENLSKDFTDYLLEKTEDYGVMQSILQDPSRRREEMSGFLDAYRQKHFHQPHVNQEDLIKKPFGSEGSQLKQRVQGQVHQDLFDQGMDKIATEKPSGFDLSVPTGNERRYKANPWQREEDPAWLDGDTAEQFDLLLKEGKLLMEGRAYNGEHRLDFAREKLQKGQPLDEVVGGKLQGFKEKVDLGFLKGITESTVTGKVCKTAKGVIDDPSKIDDFFHNLLPAPEGLTKAKDAKEAQEWLQEYNAERAQNQDQKKPKN